MSRLFTNIFIPVDFSENTDVAIQKAIELSQPENPPEIHLFHVSNPSVYLAGCTVYGYRSYSPVSSDWGNSTLQMRMQPYQDKIKKALPGAGVAIHLATGGNIQQHIVEAANFLKAPLIIIGKRKGHNWLPYLNTADPSFIAQKTNSVVLTVKPGAMNKQVKSIVFPVRTFFPARKIELLSELTERHRVKIYLVALHDKHAQASVYVDTYRTLLKYVHSPIEYKMLEGDNFPKAIFNYAKKMGADMILANPYAETKTNTYYGTDICDLISPSSNLAVLTAEPFGE